jgi:hypothetical protein
MINLDSDTIDDAADTLPFGRFDFNTEASTDPDATSIYDLREAPPSRYAARFAARRGQIREARQNIAGLRDALGEGWDVGPELAHEQQRLAALEATDRS